MPIFQSFVVAIFIYLCILKVKPLLIFCFVVDNFEFALCTFCNEYFKSMYKTVPKNFIQQRKKKKNFDFLRRFLNFKRTIVLFAFPCLVAHPMHFQKGSWNGRENVQKWPFLAKPNCQCYAGLPWKMDKKHNYYIYK